jgi:para-nitrobenzyl esterase
VSTTLRATHVATTTGPAVGRVRGVVVDGVRVGVGSWRGLPCATVAARFAPAGPPPRWTEPRDATVSAPPWPQAGAGSPGAVVGEECGVLTLDVAAPTEPTASTTLPVLVFVHGGAFVGGGPSDYDGAWLAARLPAVVVTVSYRLGALGFTTRSGPTPALTDLVAALEWVGDHAAAFGGDPGRVTVAGQSAGAAMVSSLLTTRAARGRFRAGVVLSGSGWVRSPEQAADVEAALAAELDGEPATVPAAELVRAGAAVAARTTPGDPVGVPFLPVVDGTVLPVAPLDAIRAGALADVPLWVQTCRDEMALFLPDADPAEQARLTAGWWERGLLDLASAQAAGGGTVWTSRVDHAPALAPFDRLGPTHGADNACLWAHPPRFPERPLLGRAGGDMAAADVAVTAALHDALARLVHGEPLPWAAGAAFPGTVFGGRDRSCRSPADRSDRGRPSPS